MFRTKASMSRRFLAGMSINCHKWKWKPLGYNHKRQNVEIARQNRHLGNLNGVKVWEACLSSPPPARIWENTIFSSAMRMFGASISTYSCSSKMGRLGLTHKPCESMTSSASAIVRIVVGLRSFYLFSFQSQGWYVLA